MPPNLAICWKHHTIRLLRVTMSQGHMVNQQETSHKEDSSETARKTNLLNNTHTTMFISKHPPQHARTSLTTEMFAHYLAGLIDADGHFSTSAQCVIAFHATDRSLAFFIKKKIGYGQVRQVSNKNACIYVCSHRQGLAYIAWLVHPHLNHPTRQMQLTTRIMAQAWCQELMDEFGQSFPKVSPFASHWLTGFVEGDGSFQIKTSKDIRVMLQVDQKESHLLELIQTRFGGYLGFRQSTQTFSYSSTSFANAFALVKYFDQFQPLGRKRLDYMYWRKCVLLIAQKAHLTDEGRLTIVELKKKLRKLRFEGTVPTSLEKDEFIGND